jgi:hypothetical protein
LTRDESESEGETGTETETETVLVVGQLKRIVTGQFIRMMKAGESIETGRMGKAGSQRRNISHLTADGGVGVVVGTKKAGRGVKMTL